MPNDWTDRARINGSASNVKVYLDMTATLSGLVVDAGDKLSCNDGANLWIVKEGVSNPVITNNGTIEFNSMGNTTGIYAYDAEVVLTGSGTLVLGGHPQNSLNYYYSSGSFLNGTTHTIRGGGSINGPMNNQGKIIADRETLILGGQVTNANELRAENAVLGIYGGVTNRTGSVMNVSGSEGVLQLASTVNGGQINPGDGLVEISNATLKNTNFGAGKVDVYSGTLQGKTVLAGTSFNLLEGASLYVTKDSLGNSTITNTGIISLDGLGYVTRLIAYEASVTLTGAGSLVMGGPNSSLEMYYSTDKFINDPEHTIRGGGSISAALTNKGTIIADNQQLTMSGAITNTGTIRAENATLTLSGPLANAGGEVSAEGAGARLDVYSSVNSGKINPGTGTVNLLSGAVLTSTVITSGKVEMPSFNYATLKGTTSLTGTAFTVQDGATLYLTSDSGGIAKMINVGSITLNSTSVDHYTAMQANDTQVTLQGGGTVFLKGPLAYLSGSFLNETTHKIRGTGTIYAAMTNKGRIMADGGTMLITGPITNSGTGAILQANTSISTLDLRTTVLGGKINPNTGLVKLVGSTLSNTTLGSGKVDVYQSNNYFKGNTVLTGTALTITDHSNLYVTQDDFTVSTITNNGAITLASSGGGSSLYALNAAVTLTGSGSLTMNAGTYLGMVYGTDRFINGVSHTIQGGGFLTANLDNLGSIMANNGVLAVSGAVANTGLMQANNATMQVTGPVINNGGVMSANGSLGLLQLQAAVNGGQINPGTGAVKLLGATLTNTTLGAGKVNVTSYPYYYPYSNFQGHTVLSGTEVTISNGSGMYASPDDYLVSTITNNGVLKLTSTTADSVLHANGAAVTLTGSGSLILGGKAGNRLDGAGFINAAGHTIRGGGTINAPLVNNGSLIAASKTLYINGGMSGAGDVAVNDGATLYLNSAIQTGNLNMSQLATLRCYYSSQVELQKSFFFAQTDEQRWNWGNGFDLTLTGQGLQEQAIEIGGFDKGLVLAGYSNNFDLGALTLTGDGTYGYLIDSINNGNRTSAEALYVDYLTVAAGATLNLNGLNLYARVDGLPYLVMPGDNFGGGSIINNILPLSSRGLSFDSVQAVAATPLPSSILFLGSGLLGLFGAGWKFNRRS